MTINYNLEPVQLISDHSVNNNFGTSMAMNDKFLAIRTIDKSSHINDVSMHLYAKSTNLSFDSNKNSYIETNVSTKLFFSELDTWFVELYFKPNKLGNKQTLFFSSNGIRSSWVDDFNFSINVNEIGCVEFYYSVGNEEPSKVTGTNKLTLLGWNKLYLYYQGTSKLLSVWVNNFSDINQYLSDFKPIGSNPKITLGRTDILVWDPEYAYYTDGDLRDIRFSKGVEAFQIISLMDTNLTLEQYNVLEKKSWKETQLLKFQYNELIDNEWNNKQIGLDNNTVLVAASKSTIGNINNAGLIFAFDYNEPEWKQAQFINANSPRKDSYFGSTLCVRDGNLLVGAPGYKSVGKNSAGSIYEFKRENDLWVQNEIIFHEDVDGIDRHIGKVVTATTDYAYVFSTALPNSSVVDSRVVYSFKKENLKWVQGQVIKCIDDDKFTAFGQLISASKNFVAISSPNYDPLKLGKVYMYKLENDSWELIQTITQDSESQKENIFGSSLFLTEDCLVIGSVARDNITGNGILYVYCNNGVSWEMSEKLSIPNSPNLGSELSSNSDSFVAGSPSFDTQLNSVYVFSTNR